MSFENLYKEKERYLLGELSNKYLKRRRDIHLIINSKLRDTVEHALKTK